MELIILVIIIGALTISVIKFVTKGKSSSSKGEDYTPASDMYSGKTKDYSTPAPQETHRKAPYEEVERKQ